MGAAMASADGVGDAAAPSRADGQSDKAVEHIIGCRAYGVGTGNGQRLGGVDLHVAVHRHPHLHMVDVLVRRDIAAKLGRERIGLVVGKFGLDVIQPVLAHKAVAADPAVVDLLARHRRAEFGWMGVAIGGCGLIHCSCSTVAGW